MPRRLPDAPTPDTIRDVASFLASDAEEFRGSVVGATWTAEALCAALWQSFRNQGFLDPLPAALSDAAQQAEARPWSRPAVLEELGSPLLSATWERQTSAPYHLEETSPQAGRSPSVKTPKNRAE